MSRSPAAAHPRSNTFVTGAIGCITASAHTQYAGAVRRVRCPALIGIGIVLALIALLHLFGVGMHH